MPKKHIVGKAYMEKTEGLESPALRAKFVKFLHVAHTEPHTHSGGQVLFCTEGEGFVEFSGYEEKLLSGTRAIIPPDVVHRTGLKQVGTWFTLP